MSACVQGVTAAKPCVYVRMLVLMNKVYACCHCTGMLSCVYVEVAIVLVVLWVC
jgi:hypothetical protein